MKQNIILHPLEIPKAVMSDLEKRNLSLRISLDTHARNAKPGRTMTDPIYFSSNDGAPHKLMFVKANRIELTELCIHPENENFLVIGDVNTKPLYLDIALCMREELDVKIQSKTLRDCDFIDLRLKQTNPVVSFFTMLKDVTHGEAIGKDEGKPASFYVTESRNLIDVDMNLVDF